MNFSTLFLITIFMLGLSLIGISIKILIKKNGKFSGTCASQNPFLNKEGEACGLCGALPEEKCKNYSTTLFSKEGLI